MSGYSPVTSAANDAAAIEAAFGGDLSSPKQQNILNSLLINAETFNSIETYATKPFHASKELRYILGDLFELTAQSDREAVLEAIAGGAARESAVAK